jgi:hypothetical protein
VGIGDAREAECAVCRGWPSALRPVMRNAVDGLPLRKPVCEACVEGIVKGRKPNEMSI